MVNNIFKFVYTVIMFIVNKFLDVYDAIHWFMKYSMVIIIMATIGYFFFVLCGYVLDQIPVVHNVVSDLLPIFKIIPSERFINYTSLYFAYGFLTISFFVISLVMTITLTISLIWFIKYLFVIVLVNLFNAIICGIKSGWKKSAYQAAIKFSPYR